jgi:hypothetical protein
MAIKIQTDALPDIGDKETDMSDKSLPALGGTSFEGLKQTNQHDAEYWSARDLQPLLGYSQWRRFEQAIERAIASCNESGNDSNHHFAGAGKPIPGGKGAVQVVQDVHLYWSPVLVRDPRPSVPQIRFVLIPSNCNVSHRVCYRTEKRRLKAHFGIS